MSIKTLSIMTYIIYSHQQLQHKSIAHLKQIYSEIGASVEVSDKRCKDSWISAITDYQSSKIQKLTPAVSDEQAKTVAPEELTPVEISFYDHEYYNGDKLVAAITYDHADFVTQRWVVMVNGKEIHRANTWAKCHNFITWHHKDGSLLVQNATETPCSTGNEIMSQIATECEKFSFDIMEDGIYRNDEKLGEVGCTDGKWWFVRSGEQERVPCDSALDAVWWLSMVDVSLATEPANKYLQYRPLEQLTGDELQRLLESEAVAV
jgi:hypothetical protein